MPVDSLLVVVLQCSGLNRCVSLETPRLSSCPCLALQRCSYLVLVLVLVLDLILVSGARGPGVYVYFRPPCECLQLAPKVRQMLLAGSHLLGEHMDGVHDCISVHLLHVGDPINWSTACGVGRIKHRVCMRRSGGTVRFSTARPLKPRRCCLPLYGHVVIEEAADAAVHRFRPGVGGRRPPATITAAAAASAAAPVAAVAAVAPIAILFLSHERLSRPHLLLRRRPQNVEQLSTIGRLGESRGPLLARRGVCYYPRHAYSLE
mmetsp:Transcript_7508/g.18632  ORF Transcript_7508/g.18632 Transcript_7508/m.18632 type:complete len:262 (-) Transcript_7508:1804-2589(-)